LWYSVLFVWWTCVGGSVRGIGSVSWYSGVLVRVNVLVLVWLNSGVLLYVNTVRNGTVPVQ
jgi:hypothetical protein